MSACLQFELRLHLCLTTWYVNSSIFWIVPSTICHLRLSLKPGDGERYSSVMEKQVCQVHLVEKNTREVLCWCSTVMLKYTDYCCPSVSFTFFPHQIIFSIIVIDETDGLLKKSIPDKNIEPKVFKCITIKPYHLNNAVIKSIYCEIQHEVMPGIVRSALICHCFVFSVIRGKYLLTYCCSLKEVEGWIHFCRSKQLH